MGIWLAIPLHGRVQPHPWDAAGYIWIPQQSWPEAVARQIISMNYHLDAFSSHH